MSLKRSRKKIFRVGDYVEVTTIPGSNRFGRIAKKVRDVEPPAVRVQWPDSIVLTFVPVEDLRHSSRERYMNASRHSPGSRK